MAAPLTFTTAHSFNAPRQAVWDAWTTEQKLKIWFGPKGCPVIYGKLDLQPGGAFHYALKMPDGSNMWGKWVYKAISAPDMLAFTVVFSNKSGDTIRHPWDPTWPMETLSLVNFEERGPVTTVNVTWSIDSDNETEREAFEKGREAMKRGWEGTFEQLDAFL